MLFFSYFSQFCSSYTIYSNIYIRTHSNGTEHVGEIVCEEEEEEAFVGEISP